MKKVLTYIILKLIEITIILFVPYFLGSRFFILTGFLFEKIEPTLTGFWAQGMLMLLIGFAAAMIVYLLAQINVWLINKIPWIKKNERS